MIGEVSSSLWLFGYGSLVWRPGFAYSAVRVGFVRGYSRRFWQGDCEHRGTPQQPGRVVTLIEDKDACTWGVAFEVRSHEIAPALAHLAVREQELGGYDTRFVDFVTEEGDAVTALVYIATPHNRQFVGPASPQAIGAVVAGCSGHAGHNVEYVLRLAQAMRQLCPRVRDHHLEEVEVATLQALFTRHVLLSVPASGSYPTDLFAVLRDFLNSNKGLDCIKTSLETFRTFLQGMHFTQTTDSKA